MQNFNCCILGTENSGKSSYIKQFCTNIKENNLSPFKIVCNNFNIVNGKENSDVYAKSFFTVLFDDKEILSFSVNDYAGTIFKSRNEQSESYNKLTSDVQNADFLILMMDGDLFSEEDSEKVIRTIKRKCSRYYTPLVSTCSDNRELPPIMFVVTKCKNMIDFFDEQTAVDIIKKSFDGIFADGTSDNQLYITLIESYSESGFSIPILTAIKHFLNIIGEELNKDIDNKNKRLNDSKRDKENFLSEQENRLILKNPFKMKEAREDIDYINSKINENEQFRSNHTIWSNQKKLNEILSCELDKNRKFLTSIFHNGTDEVNEAVQNNDKS